MKRTIKTIKAELYDVVVKRSYQKVQHQEILDQLANEETTLLSELAEVSKEKRESSYKEAVSKKKAEKEKKP